jgi:hypothetical protein
MIIMHVRRNKSLMATMCNHLSLIFNPFQYPRSKNYGHDIRNLTYILTFQSALIEDFKLLHLHTILLTTYSATMLNLIYLLTIIKIVGDFQLPHVQIVKCNKN